MQDVETATTFLKRFQSVLSGYVVTAATWIKATSLVCNNPPVLIFQDKELNNNRFVGIEVIAMLGCIDQGFLQTKP